MRSAYRFLRYAITIVTVAVDIACAQAASFDCVRSCNIERDDAYPNLVVGTIEGIADAEQSAALFSQMRKKNHWRSLPAGSESFFHAVQPIAIRLASGVKFIVLISQEEVKAAPSRIGDFVRYAPHRGFKEMPPTDPVSLAYWRMVGCIERLCTPGDAACTSVFRTGIYRTDDGRSLTPDGRSPASDGFRIDPISFRPR